MLAEFHRASDALTAALALQIRNTERNRAWTDEIRPAIRIGLALGEVVIADNTITGSGVVMAQRLEQLAEPGGVCLQGSVQESVPKRFPFEYRDLGPQSLKGFDEPVRACAASLQDAESLPAPESDASSGLQIETSARQRAAAVAVALLLIAVGLLAWWQPWTGAPEAPVSTTEPVRALPRAAPETDEGEVLPLPDKPSIAVLAFENMSDDPKQDYFAEGIAEDIITDLSKVSELFVIARHSSFSYKDKNVPVKTIARELGVRYVLEGSVRPTGERLRINAQLIDATTDGHVWADRFDGQRDDPFELEEKVLHGVLDAITVRLTTSEEQELGLRYTTTPEAYDLFVRARQKTFVWDFSDADEARTSLLRAIELDPDFAEAYGLLAQTNTIILRIADDVRLATLREETPRLVERSLELRKNVFAYQGAAWFQLYFRGDPEGAEKYALEGLQLNQSHADLSVLLALSQLYSGSIDAAYDSIRNAMRLNPSFPPSDRTALGKIYLAAGRYREAIPELPAEAHMGQRVGLDQFVRAYVAGAHAYFGELEKASGYAEVWRDMSDWSLQIWEPYRDQALANKLREGLELAGVEFAAQ